MAESQRELADRLFPIRKASEEDDTELRNIPPEQRRLHTETSDMTVFSLHQYMASGKIEIPEFQRGYVWTRTQASRLIESLLIQCPIPVVYFSQSSDNKLIVIDGNQRLLSIKLFINDAFPLQGLTTYPEVNDNTWSALDPRFRDHISNRTIRCITILKDTHPQIKFDVFERLNTGSVKLNAQELRHGLFHGSLMKMIDELTKTDRWKTASGFRSDKRMKGAELILRYFALRDEREHYEKPLSGFLDRYSAKVRHLPDQSVNSMTSNFKDVMEKVHHGLGKLAFRLFDKDFRAVTPFNSALYDAEMIGFNETTSKKLNSGDYKPKELYEHLFPLFQNTKFVTSIRQATSNELAVRTRLDMFLDHLNMF